MCGVFSIRLFDYSYWNRFLFEKYTENWKQKVFYLFYFIYFLFFSEKQKKIHCLVSFVCSALCKQIAILKFISIFVFCTYFILCIHEIFYIFTFLFCIYSFSKCTCFFFFFFWTWKMKKNRERNFVENFEEYREGKKCKYIY